MKFALMKSKIQNNLWVEIKYVKYYQKLGSQKYFFSCLFLPPISIQLISCTLKFTRRSKRSIPCIFLSETQTCACC